MDYPIKTLSQLHLILQGFRKANNLTQAALAERLGITQQSYAQLEANPASASVERLFKVLRALDVELVLSGDTPAASAKSDPVVETGLKAVAPTGHRAPGSKGSTSAARAKTGRVVKTPGNPADTGAVKQAKTRQVAMAAKKKESW